MVSIQQLRERLSYDPKTGQFIWMQPMSNRVSKGDVAGTTRKGLNQAKARADSSTGVRGVKHDNERGGFIARLTVRGKQVFHRRFATIEGAASARRAAELEHFGEFAPCRY